ncbi:MAG: ABC transporter ATP-binding protein [Phycisphaerae bacterium]|nr:ABC transporter ATP-binding protein [Phycisphaerae bacterium]
MKSGDEPILRGCGIRKAFGSGDAATAVLRGLDIEIRRGEFVAIMGPSGCGKSTLLHILGLMMPPTAADELTIDGVSTLRLNDSRRTQLRREKMGFVFQRFNLLPVLTTERNIRIALTLRGIHPDGQVDAILKDVDLLDARKKKPGQLSIGQQQRVAIARALVTRPALLLADEPTGNLDSGNTQRILDLLRRFRDRDGQTILMITHNPQCTDWADRVLQMKDGRFE